MWWVSTRHGKKQWCAAFGGQYNWKHPNRVLLTQNSAYPSEAKVFWARAPPQGACESLVCALKLLANQQTGGDSLVDTLSGGLQEKSRLKMMEELRRFFKVDDHEAVKIGDLEKYQVVLHVVGSNFNRADFPEAAVREGVELTLRREEECVLLTFIDTTNVGGTVDGGHRLWMRTGAQSAKPSTRVSRERSGRSSATSMWN